MFRVLSLFLALICPFQTTFAVTSYTGDYEPTTYPFDYFWAPCCNKLELFITLPDRFEFDGTYWTHVIPKGLGCTLICRPIPGHKHYSEKMLLKEMQIVLELSNSNIANEVNYTIEVEATYEDSGWFGTNDEVYALTRSGILTNTRINESLRPVFTIEEGSAPVGSISFDTR